MKQSDNLTILAIETSCDDTCVTIVKVKNQKSKVKSFDVLSNVVSSQIEIHQKYGGVYPSLAKREHQKNLPIIIKKVLKKAKKIDLIAVTVGPGLEPCLWTGVNFAKKLAEEWNLPIVPVNHIEAHILINFIKKFQVLSFKFQEIFPAVCLVVSGGHTQLILMQDFGKYKILGETRDDAAGECFDKVARILGLGYPGGPAIAKEASKNPLRPVLDGNFRRGRASPKLPRPMLHQKNYDFSFSGLKTAVLYKVKNLRNRVPKKELGSLAKEVQQAIIDVLIKKTLKAAKDFKAKTIILGGGVTANDELRKQFKFKIKNLKLKINFLVPPKNFCTDNAVMTAIAAYFNLNKKTKNWQKIKANANIKL